MKTTTTLCLLLAVVGCASRSYTKHADGSVTLQSNTLFTGSKVSKVSVTDKGFTVGAAESTGDAATIQAVAAGVMAGLKASGGIP